MYNLTQFAERLPDMNNELFANLSRSAQEQYRIQDEILQGKFGRPGDVFMTTRALAEQRQVSVVTAHNILNGLCTAGYLELRGKKYYLAHAKLMETHNSQTNIIGLIIPHLNNEFYSSLSDAVIETCRQKGYQVLVLSTSYYPSEEKRVLELIQHLNVAGIINCVPSPPENEALYRNLSIPCIFLGHDLEGCRKSSVQVNSFSISQRVARHLIEEGYRKFLYIGTKNLTLEKDIRFMAFQMELKANGYLLENRNTLRISTDSHSDDGKLIQLLKNQTEPVGIFCYHDLLAVQIYRVCNLLNKRIPEDVGIVGFDDLSIASSLSPALTTIQYRIASMADMTVNLLMGSIHSPNEPYDNYYVEPNLVIRGSSILSGH